MEIADHRTRNSWDPTGVQEAHPQHHDTHQRRDVQELPLQSFVSLDRMSVFSYSVRTKK